MSKWQLISKVLELISKLEEIITSEGKRNSEASELQECRGDLRTLLKKLRSPGESVNPNEVLLLSYKAVEHIASWLEGKEEK
ncbi:MAG: hypothetical protein HY597_05730 [Candidatus Omnitrophica bacterium]|nr:hypothetical protein [Candidatus Omnitrophota bacterium]